jgi:hypothetical protein
VTEVRLRGGERCEFERVAGGLGHLRDLGEARLRHVCGRGGEVCEDCAMSTIILWSINV